MKRRIAQLIALLWIALLMLPSFAHAEYQWRDTSNASATRAAADTTAAATRQSALIYGGSIVLAGIAIGAGIYLGLRRKG